MKTGAAAGIVFCLGASLSFAQEVSDPGLRSLPRDRSAMGSQVGVPFSADTGRLSGTVVAANGKGVFDAVVQLEASSGRVFASAHTNTAGQFNFDMVPYGRYEVIANHGTAIVSENIEVSNSFASVNLQIDTSDPNAPRDQNGIVSVAQYRIPRRARDAYEKAEAAIAHHRPEEVSKYVQKAIEIYPAYAPALTLRGAVSLDNNDVSAAIDDFDKAIHSDSTYAMAHAAMAAALNRLGKFDDALRAAERASSLSPNAFQPYFEMARAYAGKADYPRAMQQLARGQGYLRQEFAPIHLLRANILLGLANYDEAANELKSFLRIAPNDPNSSVAREALGRINAFATSSANVPNTNTAR